jgi:tRNA pseudouridine55 synthase
MNGILLVDKSKGVSSFDVIRELRSALPTKEKMGHAGSLDPFATGLLIVMFGKATKLNDLIHTLPKTYCLKAEFGYETDTQDPEGKIIEESGNTEFAEGEIEEVIKKKLTGTISQLPPKYSAKKIGGTPAYKLARQGKEVPLAKKEVNIYGWEKVIYDSPILEAEVEVETGTYVRTLAVDLGRMLNSAATAVELRRLSIGPFQVDRSVDFGELRDVDISDKLVSIEETKSLINSF